MRFSIALAVMLAAPCAAQELACREEKPPTGDLGIGGFQCVAAGCSVNEFRNNRYRHQFSAEPYVWSIDPEGASAGKLEEGDRIVAIDDVLVTTPSGGERLANLTPGKSVSLRVRRDDRILSVTLVPRLGCNMPYIRVTSDMQRMGPPRGWKRDKSVVVPRK